MAAIKYYDVKDRVRLSGSFTDPDGVAYDPSGVVVRVRAPGGVRVYTYGDDVELVKDDVGEYHLDFYIDRSGTHWYRFEATGGGVTASESSFIAKDTKF